MAADAGNTVTPPADGWVLYIPRLGERLHLTLSSIEFEVEADIEFSSSTTDREPTDWEVQNLLCGHEARCKAVEQSARPERYCTACVARAVSIGVLDSETPFATAVLNASDRGG